MKKLLSLLSIFAIVLSCSSDETSTPVTPTPAPIVKYTINITAGEGGTVSTTGGEYESGQTVSVTATPQGEYLFKDWSDGNTNATRTITVSSNSTLTANFEKRKYPLTINFEGEGEVIEEIVNTGRTTEYDSGTTVKLTAQAAAEWVFVGWTGDIESTEESVQIVIGEPKEVTATFEKKKYPLTVNIDGEGEVIEEIVNAGRTTDYDSGTTVKLTAQPEGEWLFTGWSGDIGEIDPTDNPIQLSIIESKTVTATFEKKKYPLTVNIDGEGEVLEEIVNAGRTTDYDSGTTVKLTAVPAEGWEFVAWTGALESTELEVQLLVSEAKEVNAEFKELEIVSISIEDPKEILIVSHKFSPIVYAYYTNGEKLDISSNVKISSVNKKTTILSDNTIIGAIKGDEKLIFDYKEQSTSLEIFINNIEFEELDSKFLEVKESTIKVPFLMINVFPTNDGIIHNDTIGPSSYWEIKNPSLEDSKSKIKNILLTSKNAVDLGTAFRDYGENQVKPYVSMLPLAYINIYVSNENEYKTKKTWNNKQTYDYIKMFSDLKIENYVNTKELKEIWITDFPYGGYPSLTNSGLYNELNDTWLPESNMSSPFTGDVSNSYQVPDDLPIYSNTYVVYGNSGHRGVDTNIHNRGHQIERQLRYVEKNKKSGQELFWNKFVGVDESGNQAMNKRSGNTHFPPNAKSDYDYCNEDQIESDIFNWTPEGGDKQQVKCGSWRNLSLNFTYNKYSDDGISNINNDPQTKWLITWFQSIPGENNNIPYLIDGRNYKLTNWWDLFYNWDNSINQNKTLWTNESREESNIYIDKNGVTIKAEPWAKVGDKGIIDGVEYTIVDEATLRQMVANDEDVTKVVTTKITDMSNLFKNKSVFNKDIGSWDTSSVTNMYDTFYGTNFNQDISNWDVSNVRLMQGTFAQSQFNQPIGNWDISNVSNMRYMFWDASTFNQDLSNWCVTNFTSAPLAFDTGATAWTLPKPVWGTCPE
jgi:surface protein